LPGIWGALFRRPKRLRNPLFLREYVTMEEWEYNLGPTAFIRYLRFENDILTRITIGDYGY
jgi:hypothetical protein